MQHNRRLEHIFRANGRALIVAMDHGLLDGPKRGLENAGETIQKVIEGGADAILTSYGVGTGRVRADSARRWRRHEPE